MECGGCERLRSRDFVIFDDCRGGCIDSRGA